MDNQNQDSADVEAANEATFRFTIKDFDDLKESVLSPPFYVRNLPWKIMATTRTYEHQESLGFFLQCDSESESTTWSCDAQADFRILPQKDGCQPFSRRIQHVFNRKEYDWGFSQFLSWADIIHAEKGFVKDDTIILEVWVSADVPHGVSCDSKRHVDDTINQEACKAIPEIPAKAIPEISAEAIPKSPAELGNQVQQAAGQVQEAVGGGDANSPMPQRLTSHQSQLNSHGSTAIKGVADLKNLGQDMADVYHSGCDNVQKMIEPLAQTEGPYFEHAQKVVKPCANPVSEEVRKALGEAGEQVRGAWEKLTSKSGQSLPSGAPSFERATDQLQRAGDQLQRVGDQLQRCGDQLQRSGDQLQRTGDQLQRAGEQLQHAATNAVQQLEQAAEEAASKVGA